MKLEINRQLVCRLRRLTRLRKVYLENSECVTGEAIKRDRLGHEVPVIVILKPHNYSVRLAPFIT